MADLTYIVTPGELVKRFSWEMENRENPDADSVQFMQLRKDFVDFNRTSADEREAEISRLESYFSKTR